MSIRKFRIKETYSKVKGKILESITFDERSGNLYYIDVPLGLVYVESSDKNIRVYKVSDTVGVIGLTTNPENLICGVTDGIIILDIKTGDVSRKVTFPNKNIVNGFQLRSNDGSVAPDGSFWVGTMLETEDQSLGSMWKFSTKHGLECLWEGIGVPNGLNWDLKRNCMYWTDSMKFTIFRGENLNDNYTTNPNLLKPWFVGHGEPDGSCIDSEGNLYVAIWGGFKLCRVTPNNVIDMEWNFPSKNIASCTFGGKNLSTLYVTSADLKEGDISNKNDLGGVIYEIDMAEFGIHGTPKFHYIL